MRVNRADVIAVLDRAADRLSKRGAWTRGADARNKYGMETTTPWSPNATSWCLNGALHVETPRRGYKLQDAAEAAVVAVLREDDDAYSDDVTNFNDQSHDKRRVIRLLRRTADRLRQETP